MHGYCIQTLALALAIVNVNIPAALEGRIIDPLPKFPFQYGFAAVADCQAVQSEEFDREKGLLLQRLRFSQEAADSAGRRCRCIRRWV